jgi:biopolymer transport protein ExbD
MKINLPSSSDDVQINIIPLIDVIFCILTFFLLASLQFTRQEAINVDLPKAETGTTDNTKNNNNPAGVNAPSGRQILPLVIDAIGQTYVGEDARPIQRQQISEAFKSYIDKNPNAVLALKANNKATYNEIIQIMDLWRQLGGKSVAFVTQPGDSSAGTNTPTQSVPNLPMNTNEPVNPEMLPPVAPVPNNVPVVPGGSSPQINNPNLLIPAPTTPIPGQPTTGGGIIPGNPSGVNINPNSSNTTPVAPPVAPKAPASGNR